MKLRIKGDSLRLRVSPSEVARLMAAGRVEETVHFGPGETAKLTYALECSAQADAITARYCASEIAVLVPSEDARKWADGLQVGMYKSVHMGDGRLELAIEKDFACLDRSEAENEDTYPNPKQGAAC